MPYIESSEKKGSVKVALLGAAGGIGQPLTLLLKTQLGAKILGQENKQLELALYDIAPILEGVSADVSHVNTPVLLKHYIPKDRDDESALSECLQGASLVIIPAGVPRKPGMSRDDLFAINAGIIRTLAKGIAGNCDLSKVFVLVISNPVNSLVPVMVEELAKEAKRLEIAAPVQRRVFGVTHLDAVRASTFLQQLTNYSGNRVPSVPVIGGHSGETILPLFGEAQKELGFSDEQLAKLVHRVQYGGDEVVEAKKGAGSATLSMAYAGYEFASNFADLLLGTVDKINVTTFISLLDADKAPVAEGASEVLEATDNTEYFAVPLEVTAEEGIVKIDTSFLTQLNENNTRKLLTACISALKKNIELGITFAS
ncbi:HBL288Cp [Eremothecium sinecaudum]|uniref:malate dehydrogenase n=1 Tax=Eremothecium sinecaudum TaxID=45286 RepID=A0A120K0R4_9SACH|nr:HBL288Cp [Eremothecium sinecaudum]AMD18614.1 HBL288Cp [Eremothecium sinecaudum]